jgi:hypothetical protein
MRARDVARPTAQDLADAERDLVIRRAAARVDNRPLPHGIAPAPVADRPAAPTGPTGPTGPEERSGRSTRPTPHPPARRERDQPPEGSGGS